MELDEIYFLMEIVELLLHNFEISQSIKKVSKFYSFFFIHLWFSILFILVNIFTCLLRWCLTNFISQFSFCFRHDFFSFRIYYIYFIGCLLFFLRSTQHFSFFNHLQFSFLVTIFFLVHFFFTLLLLYLLLYIGLSFRLIDFLLCVIRL